MLNIRAGLSKLRIAAIPTAVLAGASVCGPLRVPALVRTATKKAAGSRTSMRDSAGRRLGVKKPDGSLCQNGDIIVRQRGTRFFPGENCRIGRDHTIYAVEPGYVRIYLDPFHPKRRLIGVALEKHLLLPTPHFAPRVRRFGYAPIERVVDAAEEEARMLKQEKLQLPLQRAAEAERIENDRAQAARYDEQLAALAPQVASPLAGARLVEIARQLKAGRDLATAQTVTSFAYHFDHRAQPGLSEAYVAMAAAVDGAVSFHPVTYALVAHMSEEEVAQQKAQLVAQLEALGRQGAAEGCKLLDAAVVFTTEEREELKRDVLKVGLDGSVKMFNRKTRRVEVVEKEALGFSP